MTNNIIAFDFNGVKVLKDDNTAIIRLENPGSVSPETMHDARDDTDYQVPTGKKATIIYIGSTTLAAASDQIMYADDVDGNTNEVVLFKPQANVSNEIFISAEVPADKYINVSDSASQTIYIVEENA